VSWRGGSIRLRLGLASVATIAVAVLLAWLGLKMLFDRQAIGLAQQELQSRTYVLASTFNPRQPPSDPPLSAGGDPNYMRPYSGSYWQIGIGDQQWRSRSLWDHVLAVPADRPPVGGVRMFEADGPDGQRLVILDRTISVGPGNEPVRITVATSRARFEEARGLFGRDVLPFLVGLGLFLVLASAAQVAFGLRAFSGIGRDIEALDRGGLSRLGQDLPQEVRPLAAAVDALLDDRDRRIARARHRAADLAHTLKTPMQAVLGETARLRDRGECDSADAIDEIVGTIRSRIDRELGRASIGTEAAANLSAAVEKVVSVLRRTPRGEGLAIGVDVPRDLAVRLDSHDLIEALGSVLENAVRHARTLVDVRAEAQPSGVRLMIRDDGPGVPEAHLDRILRRGTRLDSDGTGLGLALAQDILDASGGVLALRNRPDGFEVTFVLREAVGDAAKGEAVLPL
jgi:signal transduction histidine kinase